MRKRSELGMIFKKILGSNNVYFSPPSSIKLEYPCIIYSLKDVNTRSADNQNYIQNRTYDVQLIDKNPDTNFIDDILEIPRSRFNNAYSANNLMHYNFTINF